MSNSSNPFYFCLVRSVSAADSNKICSSWSLNTSCRYISHSVFEFDKLIAKCKVCPKLWPNYLLVSLLPPLMPHRLILLLFGGMFALTFVNFMTMRNTIQKADFVNKCIHVFWACENLLSYIYVFTLHGAHIGRVEGVQAFPGWHTVKLDAHAIL